MNTLLALISTAVDSCVLAKLSLDALGRAAVFVSSAKPGSRHPGLLARQNYSSRSFGTSSIQGMPNPNYRHRLLLMLDEFPSLQDAHERLKPLFIDRLCDDAKGDRLLAMHQVPDTEVGSRHVVATTGSR